MGLGITMHWWRPWRGQIFIDGSSRASATASLSMGGTADFEIGDIDTGGSGAAYSGTIDEVRMSKVARIPLHSRRRLLSLLTRTQSDIGSLMRAAAALPLMPRVSTTARSKEARRHLG